MYAAMAALMAGRDHAYKWRVLARQETKIKQEVRTLLARYGRNTEEYASSRDAGVCAATEYAAMPWKQLMQRFSRELEADIATYKALEANCPPEDKAVLRRLTQHEVLTKQFCDLELDGKHETSITGVVEFLAASLT